MSLMCPACSAPVEASATWCSNCGGVLPTAAPLPPPPRVVDPVRSASNRALFFALPGLCCAPLAAVGGVYGVRAIMLARRLQRALPARAVVALVTAAISLVLWIAMVSSFRSFQREREQLREAVRQRLAGKREAAAIDQAVACDLVEEQLRAGLFEGWEAERVTCQGPFEQGPDRARIAGVEMEFSIHRIRLTACLARAQRWFVLGLTDGPCPDPPRAIPASLTEAEEDVLRRQATEQGDEKTVAAYLAALARVRDGVAGSARSTRFCPPLDIPSLTSSKDAIRLHVRTADLERLEARTARPLAAEWDFLTSNEVRTAMDLRVPIKQRASAVRRLGMDAGPYLVVLQGMERTWPVDVDEETGEPLLVGRGRWAGWMVVVDTRNAQAVCETPLSFETSRRPRERSMRKRAEAAVKELEKEFEDQATKRMVAASGRQFRLGYKLLE